MTKSGLDDIIVITGLPGCDKKKRGCNIMLLHPLWYVYAEFPGLEIHLVEFVGEALRLI